MIDFRQNHPDGVILALDQMSLYFQATLTRVWSPVGHTPQVRVAAQRQYVNFYGALDVLSGREIALSLPKQNGEMTVHFLKHILTCLPDLRSMSGSWPGMPSATTIPVLRSDNCDKHSTAIWKTTHFASGGLRSIYRPFCVMSNYFVY